MQQETNGTECSAELSIGISVVHACMVVPIPTDLRDDVVRQVQSAILSRLEHAEIEAVILDFTAVCVLDTWAFKAFSDTARMVGLFGAKTVFAGLRPGVVSALIDLKLDLDNICGALSLEDALERFEPSAPSPAVRPQAVAGGAAQDTPQEADHVRQG